MGWEWPENMPEEFGGSYDDEDVEELTPAQRAALKYELEPDENLLRAERPCPPPAPTVAAFPALFTAVLCGLSGFALAVVFGIYGRREIEPGAMWVSILLAPAAIGFFIALAWTGRWLHYLRSRWKLAHTFYALTDRRALVGRDFDDEDPIFFHSITNDDFDDTLCNENPDGSGDVFFVREGDVVAPEAGFVCVSEARRVDELVREALLGNDPRVGFDW